MTAMLVPNSRRFLPGRKVRRRLRVHTRQIVGDMLPLGAAFDGWARPAT